MEYIKSNKNIYKIGRTQQKNLDRTKQYPGCKVILFIECCDYVKSENDLIKIFNKKYKLYNGREYFEGNYLDMVNTINSYLYDKRKELEKIAEEYFLDETGYLFDEMKPDYELLNNEFYNNDYYNDINWYRKNKTKYIGIDVNLETLKFDTYISYELTFKSDDWVECYNNLENIKDELLENIYKNKIMQLNLKSIHIYDSYLDKIGSLNLLLNIKELIITGNILKTINFKSISPLNSLYNLQIINLENNKLTNIDELKIVINLKHLNLNNNCFDEIPEVITTFKNLKILEMNKNRIKYISYNMKNLINLEQLSLNNNIIETIPYSITYLSYLKYIDISSNKLKDLKFLFELKNINTISAKGNDIKYYKQKINKSLKKICLDILTFKSIKKQEKFEYYYNITSNINIKLYLYIYLYCHKISIENLLDIKIGKNETISNNTIHIYKNFSYIKINYNKINLGNYHASKICSIVLDNKELVHEKLNLLYNELCKKNKEYLFEINNKKIPKKYFYILLNKEFSKILKMKQFQRKVGSYVIEYKYKSYI